MYQVYRGNFTCRWCDLAVKELEDRGLPHQVFKLGMADLVELWELNGMHTVPVIYQDQKLIGGCSELLEELK